MKNVLIVEDHSDTRLWLKNLLARIYPGVTIDDANSCEQANNLINGTDWFSLAIIDLGLPDGSGIDIIASLSERNPDTYIVVTTIFDDDQHIFSALQAGANGYLLKEQAPSQLEKRLRGMVNGDPPLSPAIARRILQYFNNIPVAKSDVDLSRREKEVLTLVAKGLSRKEISHLLEITVNTASGYIKTVYGKLNISSRAEAALEATRLGLVRVDL